MLGLRLGLGVRVRTKEPLITSKLVGLPTFFVFGCGATGFPRMVPVVGGIPLEAKAWTCRFRVRVRVRCGRYTRQVKCMWTCTRSPGQIPAVVAITPGAYTCAPKMII